MPATVPRLRGKFLMLVTSTPVPNHALLLVAMQSAIHNCHNIKYLNYKEEMAEKLATYITLNTTNHQDNMQCKDEKVFDDG